MNEIIRIVSFWIIFGLACGVLGLFLALGAWLYLLNA